MHEFYLMLSGFMLTEFVLNGFHFNMILCYQVLLTYKSMQGSWILLYVIRVYVNGVCVKWVPLYKDIVLSGAFNIQNAGHITLLYHGCVYRICVKGFHCFSQMVYKFETSYSPHFSLIIQSFTGLRESGISQWRQKKKKKKKYGGHEIHFIL